MSAQVTEAHKALTESVCELLDSEEMVGPSPAEQAAQLIADSEAKAVVEIAMVAAESADRNVSLRLERDQLRAECLNLRADLDAIKAIRDEEKARAASAEREVERLKPYVSKAVLTHEGTMLCSPLVAVKFNEQATRAERAEAEVERLTAEVGMLRGYDCGAMQEAEDGPTPDGECGVCIKCLRARAERAEAELATAKAIIASIEEDGTEEHNAAVRLRQELAAERVKAQTLRSACESIEEQWDKNHSANPFHAGNVMQSHAMRALAATEDAT